MDTEYELPSPHTSEELISAALEARQNAYAPYSRYQVGAAVLCADGTIVMGCNVENASYPATICAERVALSAAIAQGKSKFLALAVATEDGGSPCGICRQVISELGSQMIVYICDSQGLYRSSTSNRLLPDAFDSSSLRNSPS